MTWDQWKGLLGILPFVSAIFSHYQTVKKRYDWNMRQTRSLGSLGGVHMVTDWGPIWLYYLFAVVSMAVGLLVFARLTFALDFNPLGVTTWLSDNIFVLFFVWLVSTVFFVFNWPTMLLVKLGEAIPSVKRQLSFSNASWHAFEGDKANAVALEASTASPFVEEVVQSLTSEPPNPNLALRPAGLGNDEAANVLFFGHIIEGVLTDAGVRWSGELWTAFYKALGDIALTIARPFSAKALAGAPSGSFFQDVLADIRNYLPDGFPAMPMQNPSAMRVDEARTKLRNLYAGDARKMANGPFGASYESVLHDARNIEAFGKEEIRRQFAKLFVIWGLVQPLRQPKTFRIPFSRNIAALLLSKKWLRTDGDSFSTNDSRFVYAFEAAQQALVRAVAESINASTFPAIIAWRKGQAEEATRRSLDWNWFLQYRIDQHIYHMSRNAKILDWQVAAYSIKRGKNDDKEETEE